MILADLFAGTPFRIGYDNWFLVTCYIVLLAVFLFGVLQPRQKSEWRSAGAAQAWVIALYAEMYGTPLTAYLLMGWLGGTDADAANHFNGHMWPLLFGPPGSDAVVLAQMITTVVGQTLVALGAILALIGWRQIHRAVQEERMADFGLYHYIRHPQYLGFFLFLLGSVVNWPTLPTVLTLPVLWVVYLRLARMEEQDSIALFGDQYREYMSRTGRFLPGIGRVPFDGAAA